MSLPAKFWGKVAMLNCYGCSPASIRSYQNIRLFAKELVKEIKMESFGEPQIVHFGQDDKAGYTLIQLISTSNITAHFVEKTNDIYLDVFSCKDFECVTVEEITHKYFQPRRIVTQEILR